jgi:hypothetical protein
VQRWSPRGIPKQAIAQGGPLYNGLSDFTPSAFDTISHCPRLLPLLQRILKRLL